MSQKTFENLIIIVLVTAIIYLLFKNNNKNKSAYLPLKTQQDYVPEKKSFIDNITELLTDKKDTPIEQNSDDSELVGYGSDEYYEQVNEFAKEYKDFGHFSEKRVQKASDDEINQYRKSFLDFRNYTNNTSNGFDAVDQMNLERFKESNSNGMNVSDVYDKITNFKESNIDIVGMLHNEKNNDVVVSNVFNYENDTVSNGAFFFDKVTGNDNENYLHLYE